MENVWEIYGKSMGKYMGNIYFGGFLEKMSVIFSYHPLSSFIFHSFSIEKNPGSPATWKFWEAMRKTHASLARAKESAVARSALAAATAKMRQFLFGPRQKCGTWISPLISRDFTRKNDVFFFSLIY
jgi:hypothetical protein